MSFGFKMIWRWENLDLTRFSRSSTESSRLVKPMTQIGAWFDWAESKRLYKRFWFVWWQNKWKSSKIKMTLLDRFSRPDFKQVRRNARCSANEPNIFWSVSSSSCSCFVIDFNAMVSLVSINPCSRTMIMSVNFGLLMIECSTDDISWSEKKWSYCDLHGNISKSTYRCFPASPNSNQQCNIWLRKYCTPFQ